MFDNNNAYKPIILIGTYVKNPGYPKKKVETIKLCNPSDYIMCKIGEKFMNSMGEKIDQINLKLKSIYTNLNSWQKTQVARHEDRPRASFYIKKIFQDFTPLAGDFSQFRLNHTNPKIKDATT